MKAFVAVTVVLLYLIAVVFSVGLKEEFTWTRINYVWPSGRNRRYSEQISSLTEDRRYADLRGVEDGITFPDSMDRPNRETYGSQSGGYRGSYERPSRQNQQSGSSGNTGANNIDYNYVNNIPMGANRWKDKLFITVPRRRLGVPSSLNYVSMSLTERHNLPLIPYPDWETNLLPSESERSSSNQNKVKITSVYRVAVDVCDRLWVIDTGNIELPGNATRIQPSQLIIFDLNTDTIIQRHQFPQSNVRENTNLALVTVDVTKNTCGDAFAYLPDVGGYGLIVYSFKENRSWRVTHNYFFLEPLNGEFNIGGFQFQWNDGIFSIALSEMKSDGWRDAYFHSMAGIHQYKVSTRILRNETLATRSYHGTDFQVIGDRGQLSQTSASDMHQPSSVLFLGLVNQNALGCWNTNRPISDISIIQKDDSKMIYPCDIKIHEDEIILLTNTMPVFLYGQLDYDTINFRVWIDKVENAIDGTKCASQRYSQPSGRY